MEVDFGKTAGPVTGRASGFLLSLSQTAPADALVEPLKPQLFRGHWGAPRHGESIPELYPRLRAWGVHHVQFLLSDDFQYVQNHDKPGWPGDGGDWAAWEAGVTADVAAARAAGAKVEYDIWNEPDSAFFWNRSQAQYRELWKRTFLLIRRLDPGAVILGPSEAHFDEGWMRGFLLYAKANGVVPDIISWHEIESEGVPYAALGGHVDFVRKTLKENEIPVDRISINETVGEYVHQNPGAIVGWFAALEKAGVESAARSCWEEWAGLHNGFNSSLDGLVTDPKKRPRASWWLYKAYADLSGVLVETRAGPGVNVLASLDRPAKSAHIVLGRFRAGSGPVHVTLRGLEPLGGEAGEKVWIAARRIPETGWKPLPEPLPLFEGGVTCHGGVAEFDLDGLGRNDACVIELRRASSSPLTP